MKGIEKCSISSETRKLKSVSLDKIDANLDDIDEDVDGGVDGQHEMVPLGQDLSPWRPVDQAAVVEHLVSQMCTSR